VSNVTHKIISKFIIFIETQTQDRFRIFDLSFCNIFAETNNFVICIVMSLWRLEPWIVFGLVTLVSVISSRKLTNFALTTFSSKVSFRAAQTSLLDSGTGHLLDVLALCYCNILEPNALLLSCLIFEQQKASSPRIEPQLWAWRRFFILSFRVTGNAFTGKRTRGNFRDFLRSYILSVNDAKFGANRCIRFRDISEQITHKQMSTISTLYLR
jgi:hypothetical protein